MATRAGYTGWIGVVLDAPDAQALAYFYRDLLGWPLSDDEPGWCTMRIPEAPANLAFQTEEHFQPPTWPTADGHQQMMLHLDIGVTNLDSTVEAAVELGATVCEHQPQAEVRVLVDPAGHPFCLYLDLELRLVQPECVGASWSVDGRSRMSHSDGAGVAGSNNGNNGVFPP